MAMQKRACGFVIFRRLQGAIEYLLLQTSYGKHHWTPPKGHVDPGETDMRTALRETEEEAGLTSRDLKIYENARTELSYKVNGEQKVVVYWLAELLKHDQPVKLSDEHQAFRWLPLDEACTLSGHADMQSALRQFHEYIAKHVA